VNDVFISVPTGASKSLTFELAPFALDYMRNRGDKTMVMVLVVVPLVSLLKDHVNSMQKRGTAALYVGDDCKVHCLHCSLVLVSAVSTYYVSRQFSWCELPSSEDLDPSKPCFFSHLS